jgi:hypothetical protein
MSGIQRHKQMPVVVALDEVCGQLGYGDRPVPERVRDLLREVEAEATPLLEPACAIVRAESQALARSPFLGNLDAVVLCLVTIGDKVERAMEKYESAGEIGRALVLNVFGSVAAEATANAANTIIRDENARDGLRCSRRFSPGYGGWEVSEQRWILAALEGEALGVTLTEGCMMVPRKSITFAVSVGENPVEMREDNACDGCELINCSYRRKTVVKEENGRRWTTFIGPDSNYCPLDRWS